MLSQTSLPEADLLRVHRFEDLSVAGGHQSRGFGFKNLVCPEHSQGLGGMDVVQSLSQHRGEPVLVGLNFQTLTAHIHRLLMALQSRQSRRLSVERLCESLYPLVVHRRLYIPCQHLCTACAVGKSQFELAEPMKHQTAVVEQGGVCRHVSQCKGVCLRSLLEHTALEQLIRLRFDNHSSAVVGWLCADGGISHAARFHFCTNICASLSARLCCNFIIVVIIHAAPFRAVEIGVRAWFS
mmetsp:Transcript_38594/g.73947  ORF Transcript_38594/g.73947 Transcript_38594/m.73947 type:complete len:239 (+) Transcript_38594:1531-2247(+)